LRCHCGKSASLPAWQISAQDLNPEKKPGRAFGNARHGFWQMAAWPSIATLALNDGNLH
jgi:hypothetical protein